MMPHHMIHVQVAPGESDQVRHLVKDGMEAAGGGLTVPLDVNMLEGADWAEASKQ